MLWDVLRKERRVLPGTDIYRPSFSLDSKMLATGSGNDVQLWSIPDFKPLGTPCWPPWEKMARCAFGRSPRGD